MQAQKASRDFLHVTDPKAVAWLTDTKKVRLLAPFFAEALTVSEAAAQLELTLNQTYKLVKRLETLGVVRLESCQARRGRPLRYYRTTADEFFIPPSAVSFEGLLWGLGSGLERTLARSLTDVLAQGHGERPGLRVFASDPNNVSILAASVPGESLQPPHDASPSSSMWHRLSLDYEDALELRDELSALVNKYQARQGQQPYILRLALAPGTF